MSVVIQTSQTRGHSTVIHPPLVFLEYSINCVCGWGGRVCMRVCVCMCVRACACVCMFACVHPYEIKLLIYFSRELLLKGKVQYG
jgi:hypothetical protein